jgi:hypothetical protein
MRIKKVSVTNKNESPAGSELITRTYKMRVYPNESKGDTVRYAYDRHLDHVRIWVNALFFQWITGDRRLPTTAGGGQLVNQALHTATGILNAALASHKATFICRQCGHNDHADVNASKNIAAKGTLRVTELLLRNAERNDKATRSGNVSNSEVFHENVA